MNKSINQNDFSLSQGERITDYNFSKEEDSEFLFLIKIIGIAIFAIWLFISIAPEISWIYKKIFLNEINSNFLLVLGILFTGIMIAIILNINNQYSNIDSAEIFYFDTYLLVRTHHDENPSWYNEYKLDFDNIERVFLIEKRLVQISMKSKYYDELRSENRYSINLYLNRVITVKKYKKQGQQLVNFLNAKINAS